MSLLLDTHVLFWWITDDPRLADRHRRAIEVRDEPIYVSAVTGWELAIKVKLGKWPEAAVLLPGLREKVLDEGFETLGLTIAQAERAGLLELVHRDPFDRFLAAQALDLSVPIATIDPAMRLFGCAVIEEWPKASRRRSLNRLLSRRGSSARCCARLSPARS